MINADLNNRFNFHPATDETTKHRHEVVRASTLDLADRLDELLPDSREKSVAFTKLEEAMFWANAAIARHDQHGVRKLES